MDIINKIKELKKIQENEELLVSKAITNFFRNLGLEIVEIGEITLFSPIEVKVLNKNNNLTYTFKVSGEGHPEMYEWFTYVAYLENISNGSETIEQSEKFFFGKKPTSNVLEKSFEEFKEETTNIVDENVFLYLKSKEKEYQDSNLKVDVEKSHATMNNQARVSVSSHSRGILKVNFQFGYNVSSLFVYLASGEPNSKEKLYRKLDTLLVFMKNYVNMKLIVNSIDLSSLIKKLEEHELEYVFQSELGLREENVLKTTITSEYSGSEVYLEIRMKDKIELKANILLEEFVLDFSNVEELIVYLESLIQVLKSNK